MSIVFFRQRLVRDVSIVLTLRKNNKASAECGKLTITLNELSVQECSNTTTTSSSATALSNATGTGNVSSTQAPSTELDDDEELRALAQLINNTELNRPSQQTTNSVPRGLDTPPTTTSNQQSAVATPNSSQSDSSVLSNPRLPLVGAASVGSRVAQQPGQSSSIPSNGGPPGRGGEECVYVECIVRVCVYCVCNVCIVCAECIVCVYIMCVYV